MKTFKLISVFIVCTLLLLSSERTSAHGGITIDGDCSGDWGNSLPAAIHTYQVLAGAGGTEWVYRGEAGDARDSGGTTTSNNDIVEVRFTGDDISLYFCVKMADITTLDIPNINLAIDIDQSIDDAILYLVGDETCSNDTACGGEGSYLIADPIHFAERQYNSHWTGYDDFPFSIEAPENMPVMFESDPTNWAPIGVNTAAASIDGDSIEGKINWSVLGCPSGPCDELYINMTTYRNVPMDNVSGDSTYDLLESDGIDLMGGTPGITQNAWERDFSDGELSRFYLVHFDLPSTIHLQSAASSVLPEYNLLLVSVIILGLIALIGILHFQQKHIR